MEEITNNNPEQPVVFSNNKRLMKKAPLIIIGIIIIVIIVLLVIFWPKRNTNIIFTINGKTYDKAYLDPIAAFPKRFFGISTNNEYKNLLPIMKDEFVASSLGIMPNASQIASQQQDVNSQYPKYVKYPGYKTWSNQVATDQAIQDELNNRYAHGDYEGYSFIFWFGNTVDSGPVVLPNIGNTTIYNQDKAYALGRANYYYSQLNSNKMTPAQVYAAVNADPKLDLISKYPQSVHFGLDSNVSWTTQVYYQDVIFYTETQHSPTLSVVKTGTIMIDTAVNGTKEPQAFYYILDLNKVGTTSSTFSNNLNSLKVKYYGS